MTPRIKKSLTMAIPFLMVTGILVWKKIEVTADDSPSGVTTDRKTTSARYGNNASLSGSSSVNQINSTEAAPAQSLSFPAGTVLAEGPERETQVSRELIGDDAILASGDVHGDFRSDHTSEKSLLRQKRLESITAKDWQAKPNLLVNEIRTARGFQIPLDQVEVLLAGKDLYGWSEGQRNWIGDELMIMLRQDVPQEAYRIFQQVLADANAPDAMRDYSIQHISHMVAANQVGAEGVGVIRAALDSGDPIYASTALISLHRLSASQPQFISPEQVAAMAQQQVNSTDQRLRLTAQAIRKEWEAQTR